MKAGAAAAGLAATSSLAAAQPGAERVEVELGVDVGPLDHIWSRCAGSDRAVITLREEWRRDLERFHREAGLERVRFHGVFADEMGILSGLRPGKEPNFQNVDAVYDGVIERGVQPFVELSFMPGRLAASAAKFGFYGANISPPKDMAQWAALLDAFARHLIARYGAAQVRQWYFEVWNEPNLPFFWSGDQAQYFELYRVSVQTLKAVDPSLRVGGPSSAAAEWIEPFLAYCAVGDLPVDFVSTHLYAGDDQEKLFGQAGKYRHYDVIPAALAKVRGQIDATRYKGAELWLSEWSSDSPAMIAHVIKGALPHCQAMSQWAMSNVFEELGVANYILKEGDNGWGMLARYGVAKPAFNTYKLLNQLGRRRLTSTGPSLASRGETGATVLVWNLADVKQPSGIPGMSNTRDVVGETKRYEITFRGGRAGQSVEVSYVDMERGSPFPTWRKLGSPQYPSREQLTAIRSAAELAAPQRLKLGRRGELVLDLPPEGVALVRLS